MIIMGLFKEWRRYLKSHGLTGLLQTYPFQIIEENLRALYPSCLIPDIKTDRLKRINYIYINKLCGSPVTGLFGCTQ
jgi:hypothetical protein